MAASTQGERLIREPPRNISCKAGFGLFRRKVTAKSSGCGGGWVDHRLHRGDFACREAADFGVPADDRLVFGEIDAEGFIICNITFDPLDVGAELAQHIVRFRRGLAQLFPLESSDLKDIALDDEFLQSHDRPH
jgi:hypothetical protein